MNRMGVALARTLGTALVIYWESSVKDCVLLCLIVLEVTPQNHATGEKKAHKSTICGLMCGFVLLVSKYIKGFLGAQERTRTSTPLQALGPEPSASTNSATWAKKARILTI